MKLKQQLYTHCENFLSKRRFNILSTIKDIEESLNSETKSSAGDKHETGRAMLQLEREKSGKQLAELQKLQEILSKINVEKSSETISLGSVVLTTEHNYFIAIGAGEIVAEGKKFYAISTNSPIGEVLIGKYKKDKVAFRNKSFTILDVY